MTTVYVLQHESRDDEVKLIGVYGSEAEARYAIERARRLPGFSDHREGFSVDPYDLGRDHWTEGFTPVAPEHGKVLRSQDKTRAA